MFTNCSALLVNSSINCLKPSWLKSVFFVKITSQVQVSFSLSFVKCLLSRFYRKCHVLRDLAVFSLQSALAEASVVCPPRTLTFLRVVAAYSLQIAT
ncbi:MAG: hypothetical protein CM15mV106_130 [uncultured marine virus]|nr:MAG: hypothetical protein CM15mV106_130 [uncultured marine virus]